MLTIAGFDPSSGAGATADLMVFAAQGCFGTSCIAALTVQSTVGVQSTHPVDARIVARTLDCLWDDLPAQGIKIGMLGTAENVNAVAEFLERRVRGLAHEVPVVLDPVLRSSSGHTLLSQEGIAVLRERLLPLVDWVTPNLAELAMLTLTEVRTAAEMEAGARSLQQQYPGLGVVVTGGHLEPNGDASDDLAAPPENRPVWLRGRRVDSRSTHGTGCAFSSVMACALAAGHDGVRAAREAKEFVAGAIQNGKSMGSGNGPMNFAWRTSGQR